MAAAKPLKQFFEIGREQLPLIRASVSLSNYWSARRGAADPMCVVFRDVATWDRRPVSRLMNKEMKVDLGVSLAKAAAI